MENYTISHTGSTLGDDAVTLSTNQTDPQRETAIIGFECPRKFSALEMVTPQDDTRFVPRTMQTVDLTDDDGSGTLEEGELTIALNAPIQTVAGEDELDEQRYPAVVAVNVTQGAEIDAADLTIDYHRNEVVVAESAVAAGDTVKVYPILTEGSYKWHAVDGLGRDKGSLYPWGFPSYRFHDMEQDRSGREINMPGAPVRWSHHEVVELRLDSPHAIVWEDEDYPDAFVSTFEQDVTITL